MMSPHAGFSTNALAVGRFHLTNIARILEMIEQLAGIYWIHNSIVSLMPDLNYTPQRVVSLQPSATVTLQRLGLLERVVACTKWCVDICPEISTNSRAIIADSWTAKSNEILYARPDLVIASVPYQMEAVGEILKAGVRFLGLAPKSLRDIYTDIAIIALVMGAEEKGNCVIAEMQNEIALIQGRAAANPQRPKIFCEEWGKPLILSQLWVKELVEAAGGEFAGTPGSKIDFEAARNLDPDILVMAWCGAGDRVPLKKVIRQRGWEAMRAVREGQVYCIPDEFLNTPAPTLLEGARALAGILHPQFFEPHPRSRRINEQ